MSLDQWQPFVDKALVGTKNVSKAAIFGHDGTQWAGTPEFLVTVQEIKNITKGFSDASALRKDGIFISREKFLVIRADERSIYGSKGASGCVCVKTRQSILVCVYDEKIQPGHCSSEVEKLADYLLSCGF